jgi:hypothetical protein
VQSDEPHVRIADSPDFSREIALIGTRLLDDAYIAWTAAEFDTEQALRAWSDGVAGQHGAAYHAYRAAVDREEAAARDLQRLNELTAVCIEVLVA